MRIAVIGAGIVGVSCALHLRGDGHDVTLIDPRAPGTSTSFGNAGGIGTGAVVPNSTPALWRDIPRMLFDRDSAVRVSWRYLPRLAPWLIRFLLAGRHERVQAIYDREIMQARGVRLDVLGPDEVRQLEPSLARRYVKGLFQPDSAFVTSPHKLVQAHAAHFQSLGGNLAQERVRGVQPSDGGVRLDCELGIRDFGAVVLAPMLDGIRLTSGVELAGLNAPPDFSRIRRLLPAAREALPGLSDRVTREWLGYRPSTPDSLPVIGRSPRCSAVLYAFGHQHLGLTLGPITGRLIAALAAGRQPEFDLAPYRADRF